MPVPSLLAELTLPIIGAPLFMISEPGLVIAQCRAGVAGVFPALNARPQSQLASWLYGIASELGEARARGEKVAPYGVHHILHPSNTRLDQDLQACARAAVPLVTTGLGSPADVVPQVHGWGGLLFHEVTDLRQAREAAEAGVDGLVLVCAGSGGHAGALSPFAFVEEVRTFWDGPLVLAGAIATGRSIFAAQLLGADLVAMGTRFIATTEAQASDGYKAMVVGSTADDIVTTPALDGVPANVMRPSLAAAALDDEDPAPWPTRADFGPGAIKLWRDVWSAGQGVGVIGDIASTALVVARLRSEYLAARSARIRIGFAPTALSEVDEVQAPREARA